MNLKSPHLKKIWIIRGQSQRTIVRSTWIKTCLRHFNQVWHGSSVNGCHAESRQLHGTEMKPWLHCTWSYLSIDVLLYQTWKHNIVIWTITVGVSLSLNENHLIWQIAHKSRSSGLEITGPMSFFFYSTLAWALLAKKEFHTYTEPSTFTKVNVNILIQSKTFKCSVTSFVTYRANNNSRAQFWMQTLTNVLESCKDLKIFSLG